MKVVVGCDEAGVQYKKAIKEDLESDPRVSEVIDVGVNADEHTAYPHVGVAGAKAGRGRFSGPRHPRVRHGYGDGDRRQQSEGHSGQHGP